MALDGPHFIEGVDVLHALLPSPRCQLVHGNTMRDAEVLALTYLGNHWFPLARSGLHTGKQCGTSRRP